MKPVTRRRQPLLPSLVMDRHRHDAGSEVSVTWSVNPPRFWGRLLLAHARADQLRATEVPASLDALQELAERTAARAG